MRGTSRSVNVSYLSSPGPYIGGSRSCSDLARSAPKLLKRFSHVDLRADGLRQTTFRTPPARVQDSQPRYFPPDA